MKRALIVLFSLIAYNPSYAADLSNSGSPQNPSNVSVKNGAAIFVPIPKLGGTTEGSGKEGGCSDQDPVNPCPPIGKPVDISVNKTGGTTPAQVGWYSFNLAIFNTGVVFNAAAGTITISDIVPPGMSFTGVSSPPGWTCPVSVPAGGTLVCTFNGTTIPAGPLGTISITGFIPGSGPFPPVTNCGNVSVSPSSGYQDTDAANNNSCVMVSKPSSARSRPQSIQTRPVISNDNIARDTPVKTTNWGGFYGGVAIGYGWGNDKGNYYPNKPADFSFGLNNNVSGVLGSVHAGYNWQSGAVVWGVEGDLGLSGAKGSALFNNGSTRARQDFKGSLNGRLGYSFDNVMLYMTGGVVIDSLKYRTLNISNNAFDKTTTTKAGWSLGAGVEYSIANNWVARLEYRHTDLGNINRVAMTSFSGTRERHHYTDNAFRVGISRFFGN